ncbi:CheR family methyltransferase [Emticicia sp. BO119]|uniref:CheR family methyltransferase n=1 Tax=Emticicia sp. BO119 TaxID=2757768 RepID=UPI0017A427CF|nr:CheR family methyltransferase [Emticicia sp. BO119]MBA4852988.1 PAS domain-containing protein [Emticicia sp. BO119]
MRKKYSTPLPNAPQDFTIVGLGASAGGVEAFQKFIASIPKNSGMAYVLVQHLPHDQQSDLPKILAKSTELPVLEISTEVDFKPDHVYTISKSKRLISVDGILKLQPGDDVNPIAYSIDIFFHSLGEVHQNNVVGVLLSGAGTDGTLGLQAIKKYGGITFVQDPGSTDFSDMPQNAIDANTVDFVLPAEKMPEQLMKLQQVVNKNYPDEDEKAIPRSYEDVLKQIIFLIRQHKGIDFSYYKESTLRRRIARRMGLCRCEDIGEYHEYLKSNKEELELLLKDFLIPVTSFFRDSKTFQALTERVFPHLLESKLSQSTIRIWVAGCSSGEEAYSIAISLHEFLSHRAPEIKIQVFATDISESNIAKARSGLYNALDVQAIPPHLLETYFTKIDNSIYQINKSIRNSCVFAVHNFLKDPPFSKIDLVSCRNVLIYMTTFLQKKALTTFHYALKEKGILWLGKSETANVVSDLFTLISNHDKFFSRKYTTSRFTQDSHDSMEETKNHKNDTIHTPMISQTDFQKNADDILLNHYTPPCVIVSDQNDIIHFRGDTSLFFVPSPGKASLNVLKMVRKELAFDLRNLLHKAHIEKETVTKENILVKHGTDSYLVSVEVIPLLQSVALHFLIVFNKRAILPTEQESYKSGGKKAKKSLAELHIEQLEKELAQIRQDILNITESQEAANEELQNANEELLSSSEELQTLNEELETSKEELQSGNEELISMNQELINRQEHLSRTQAQLEELNKKLIIQNRAFEGAQVSSKMGSMTWNLHTDEFTYSDNLYRIFGYKSKEFIPTVKKLKSFVHPDDLPEIEKISKKLLVKKKISELSFRAFTKDGSLKYIKGTGSILNLGTENMLVASLQDVTEDILLNRNLQLREAQLSESQRIGKIGSWELDFTTNTIQWSDETYRLYGYKPGEIIIDFATFGNVHQEDIEKLRDALEKSRQTGKAFEAEYRRYDKHGDIHYIYSKGDVRKDKKGIVIGMLCISIDLTELRVKEQKLLETYQQLESKNIELEHSNAELASFSYIASHDLGDPLYKIEAFTERILLKEELTDNARDYFNRIIRSTQRMKSLLADLLNFSRMTTDEAIFAKTDMNVLLEEAKQSLSERIEEKKAVIETNTLPTLPIIPTQFYQLFANLISNSIKYSKKDVPPHIVIKASLMSGEDINDARAINIKKYWKLSFIDNGIGFEQQYEHKIFELFQRLHGKTEYSGTGIGLTICRKVVQNHEGLIEAFGKPGVGATFNVYIPERDGDTK